MTGSEQNTYLIEKGKMLNRSLHEDDDALIARENIVAKVIRILSNALVVRIPEMPDEDLYIHQPDTKK